MMNNSMTSSFQINSPFKTRFVDYFLSMLNIYLHNTAHILPLIKLFFQLIFPFFQHLTNYIRVLTDGSISNPFLLSIVDTYDISILSKNPKLLTDLSTHVKKLVYIDIKYLTKENSGTF